MTGGVDFTLPEGLDADRLERELVERLAVGALAAGELPAGEPPAGPFSLGPRRRLSEAWTYFDSFDWRLHDAGYILRGRRLGGRYELRLEPAAGEGDTDPLRQLLPGPPTFATSLPPGALARTLAPLLANRRLLPRATVRRRGVAWAVLDTRGKTVARFFAEERTVLCPDELDPAAAAPPPRQQRRREEPEGVPLPSRLCLEPLRGYGEESRPLAEHLTAELGLAPAEDDELATALAACGRHPGDYSSKIHLDLEPTAPAHEAMRQVYRWLLEVLLANEAGVRRELDPEFLHDFRVAVRRTRSALGQVKEVLPPGEVESFREGFRWLGQVTGPKRDLDVFQEDLAGHLESLPDWAREALVFLQGFLQTRAEAVQAELVTALDSDRYRKLVEGWRRFLDQDDPSPERAANALRPIAQVASERIAKAARRVRRRAGEIDETTPAAAVHRLRIECKKLRYLLELFRSLYPPGEIGRQIKALKGLQDVLGEYNDLAVQQAALRRYAGDLVREARARPGRGAGAPAQAGTTTADTLLAMGFLLAHLHRRRKKKRRQLVAALASYLEGRRLGRESRLFAAESTP